MAIDISGRSVPGLSRRQLRSRLKEVLQAHAAENGELSVSLVNDEEIRGLHERWMNIPEATDVLSFPQDEESPREGTPRLLGDVVISTDTAARQARDQGHSIASEVVLLAVHGTLHLLGYDDRAEPDRTDMREQERRFVPEAFAGVAPHVERV